MEKDRIKILWGLVAGAEVFIFLELQLFFFESTKSVKIGNFYILSLFSNTSESLDCLESCSKEVPNFTQGKLDQISDIFRVFMIQLSDLQDRGFAYFLSFFQIRIKRI